MKNEEFAFIPGFFMFFAFFAVCGTGRNTRTTHTVYVVVFLGLGRENKGDNVREERMRPAGLSGH